MQISASSVTENFIVVVDGSPGSFRLKGQKKAKLGHITNRDIAISLETLLVQFVPGVTIWPTVN